MKTSLIQMNSQDNKQKNLADARALIEAAVSDDNPDLIVLPEYFASLTDEKEAIYADSETFPDGEAYQLISSLANKHKVTIHAGTIVEHVGNNYYNTSVVFGPDGQEIAKYRKIHLFDIEGPDGEVHKESDTITRGNEIVTYQVGDFTVGCAICYDVRFPELFRILRDKGADVIVLPAAFTLMTGKDHWEPLARARAIETQTYFLAVGQTLVHDETSWCWGHTMIADPWGHVIARCSDGVGFTSANLDRDLVKQTRADIPLAQNRIL